MTIQSGSAAPSGDQELPPPMDTPDFLNRVAERLRAESGSGLPLSCFIQQVKLQLASGKTPKEIDHAAKGPDAKAVVDCYKAWAMPE